MKRFFCKCGQEIFIDNIFCEKCGRDLIFDPSSQEMWGGLLDSNVFEAHPSEASNTEKPKFKPCKNRHSSIMCNWAVCDDDEEYCIACRSTRTTPDQRFESNRKRWRSLEMAKRRLFITLLKLKLPIENYNEKPNGLAFDFLGGKRSNSKSGQNHVLSGHLNGIITLNAMEADEGYIHTMKQQMKEHYRTLLGHFRHEIGHYYWQILIYEAGKLDVFRDLFGDERQDYQEALNVYYEKSKKRRRFKSNLYITNYASSHPHEDWAETWAHYLHIVDTLETAVFYGLSTYQPKVNDFDEWYSEWGQVAQTMNALNRSMGLADAYPFIITDVVKNKLRFIDNLIDEFTYSSEPITQNRLFANKI